MDESSNIQTYEHRSKTAHFSFLVFEAQVNSTCACVEASHVFSKHVTPMKNLGQVSDILITDLRDRVTCRFINHVISF